MKRAVVALSLFALGFLGASPATSQVIPPMQVDTTPRYQVIDDMVTQQARIDALERKVKALQSSLDQANNQIAGLTILRERDVQLAAERRAEDQKRITSLELNMNTMFEGCR